MAEIKVPFVNLGLQYKRLKDDILKKFDDLSSSGSYVLSDEVKKAEEEFAKFCGTNYSIGVGNGTDALFLSLKALGIKEGDEVIVPVNSFIASAGAIVAANAKPVFVDVGEDYNINPDLIERAITPRTKAILPVHLTGKICDMDKIIEIAKKHGLFIVEDAAQAIGAKYKEKRAGSFGNIGCFSLHPLKNLHVHGDGGMIVTNSKDIHDKIMKMRNHGLINRDECEFFGYNSRLDSIQAGILNIKLKIIDKINLRHRELAEKYRVGLEKTDKIKVPFDKDYEESVYHRFIIRVGERDQLQKFLLENGIDTKVHYPIPLHLQPAAKNLGYKEGDFPVAERQSKEILSLPLYPEIEDWQVDLVVDKIKEYFSEY